MGKLDTYYIKYLEVHTGQKAIAHETPESFVDRLSCADDVRLPLSNTLFLDDRCSFLEAVLLRSKRSKLLQALDDSPDTLVFGLEKSGSFVGKHSLFCAWVVYSVDEIAWVFNNGYSKHFLGAFSRWKDGLVVTCPFSTLLGDAGKEQIE